MTISTDYMSSLRAASSSAGAAPAGAKNMIDQAGFLKLLTTQMTHQDPTAPMDTNSMTTQMSQITQTSGITEMNAALKSLVAEMTGNRIGDAASWIGKAALVASQTAQPLGNGGYAGQVTLPSSASTLSISLVDQTGATVHTETLSDRQAGAIDFAWDGRKADGATATGPMKVVVSATGADGQVQPSVATWSTVTGVQSPAGGAAAQLSTTLGIVAPTAVLSLS